MNKENKKTTTKKTQNIVMRDKKRVNKDNETKALKTQKQTTNKDLQATLKVKITLVNKVFSNDTKVLKDTTKMLKIIDKNKSLDSDTMHLLNQYFNACICKNSYYSLAYKLAIAYYKMRVIKLGLINDFKTLNGLYYAFNNYKQTLLARVQKSIDNYDIDNNKHIEILNNFDIYDVIGDMILFSYDSNFKALQKSTTYNEYTTQYEMLFKNVMRLKAKQHYKQVNGGLIRDSKIINSEYITPPQTIEYINKALCKLENFNYTIDTAKTIKRILSTKQCDLTKNDKDKITKIVKRIEIAISKNNA